jgi:hypothetical protein
LAPRRIAVHGYHHNHHQGGHQDDLYLQDSQERVRQGISFTFPAATRVGAYKKPKKKVPKAHQMAIRRSCAVQSFMGDTLKAPGE